MHWHKVTLIGVGLLGGSLGLSLKRARMAGRVSGWVRRPEAVAECAAMGVTDECFTEMVPAVENADLVVLCTPIGRMASLAEEMLPHLKPGAIVTDVGSVKATLTRELEPLFARGKTHFVGSHPMAGGEKTGVRAARGDLFENAVVAVTPTARTNRAALRKIEDFWSALGGKVVRLSPEAHDDLVSRSSHLAHVVAAALASYVLSPIHPPEQAALCATGFRDTTRVASGSPEMWRDIAVHNRANLARVLGVFIEDLQEFRLSLENGDGAAIHEFFDQARQRRDGWSAGSGAE